MSNIYSKNCDSNISNLLNRKRVSLWKKISQPGRKITKLKDGNEISQAYAKARF